MRKPRVIIQPNLSCAVCGMYLYPWFWNMCGFGFFYLMIHDKFDQCSQSEMRFFWNPEEHLEKVDHRF